MTCRSTCWHLTSIHCVHCRITFKMEASISHVDILNRRLIYTQKGSSPVEEQYDLIIGCDGRSSMVRQAMHDCNKAMNTTIVPADRFYISFCGLEPLDQPQDGKSTADGALPVCWLLPILLALSWLAMAAALARHPNICL